MSLLLALAGAAVLIGVARWLGRARVEQRSNVGSDEPGQKL